MLHEMIELATKMCIIAMRYGMKIQTCAEEIALESVGVVHGKCIDNTLIEDLLGVKLVVSKDPNQRKECGCVQSIDIGEYNTCAHGCKYCYANFKESVVAQKRASHDPNSPLLIGNLELEDKITERKLFSFIKAAEPFENGDIVKLKTPALLKIADGALGRSINLYKIISRQGDMVRLDGLSKPVSKKDLVSVKVDGLEDKWIYYDPVVAAALVFSDDPIPVHKTDYSYYLDALNRSYEGKKSFKELVDKEHLFYVHEIQHYLHKKFGSDDLRINENRNEQ